MREDDGKLNNVVFTIGCVVSISDSDSWLGAIDQDTGCTLCDASQVGLIGYCISNRATSENDVPNTNGAIGVYIGRRCNRVAEDKSGAVTSCSIVDGISNAAIDIK